MKIPRSGHGDAGITPAIGEILILVLAVAATAVLTLQLVGMLDLLAESPYAAVGQEHDADQGTITITAIDMGNSDHVNVTFTSASSVATGRLTRAESQLVVRANQTNVSAQAGAVGSEWRAGPPGAGATVNVNIVAVRKDRETVLSLTEIDGL